MANQLRMKPEDVLNLKFGEVCQRFCLCGKSTLLNQYVAIEDSAAGGVFVSKSGLVPLLNIYDALRQEPGLRDFIEKPFKATPHWRSKTIKILKQIWGFDGEEALALASAAIGLAQKIDTFIEDERDRRNSLLSLEPYANKCTE